MYSSRAQVEVISIFFNNILILIFKNFSKKKISLALGRTRNVFGRSIDMKAFMACLSSSPYVLPFTVMHDTTTTVDQGSKAERRLSGTTSNFNACRGHIRKCVNTVRGTLNPRAQVNGSKNKQKQVLSIRPRSGLHCHHQLDEAHELER